MGKVAKTKRKLGASRMNPLAPPPAPAAAAPSAAEEKQIEADAEEQTGRIMSEMTHVSPEARARAAHLVAGVASTGFMGLRVLLRSGIVAKLTAMLCDPIAEVRDAAISALRNCGIRGGDEVWAQMVKADIMTTLLAALMQQPLIRTELPAAPPARAGWEQHPDTLDETCQLLDLLWSIGECSADAIKRFNSSGLSLLPSLINLAATGGGSAAATAAASNATAVAAAAGQTPEQAAAAAAAAQVALAVSAAQTLHVLSEENPQVCSAISGSPELLAALRAAVARDTTPAMVAVLAVGILMNLGAEAQSPDVAASYARVLGKALDAQHCAAAGALLQILDAQAQRAEAAQETAGEHQEAGAAAGAAEAGEAAAAVGAAGAGIGTGPGGSADVAKGMNRKERRHAAKGLAPGAAPEAEGVKAVAHGDFNEAFLHTEGKARAAFEALNSWKDGVMVSQVALQIMANMISQDDAEDDEDEWEDGDDDEGDGMAAVGGAWVEAGPAALSSSELAGWMASAGLVERMTHHCQVPIELSHAQLAGRPAGASGAEVSAALAQLQVTSLDCFSNWMAHAPAGAEEMLVKVRDGVLAPSCAASSALPSPLQRSESEVDEALSSALMVYLERGVAVSASNPAAAQAMLHLPAHCQEALARWARAGETESIRSNALAALGLLGKTLRDPDSNRAIGTLLLQAAQAASSVLVAAEALNAVFDAYSEDDLNEAVMRPLNMIACLVAIQAPFSAAAKQWLQDAKGRARGDPQLKMHVDRLAEVRANLPRFIKYKQERGL